MSFLCHGEREWHLFYEWGNKLFKRLCCLKVTQVIGLGSWILLPYHLSTATPTLLPGVLTSQAHLDPGFSQERVAMDPRDPQSSLSSSFWTFIWIKSKGIQSWCLFIALDPHSLETLPLYFQPIPTCSRLIRRMVESYSQNSVGQNRLQCSLHGLLWISRPAVVDKEPALEVVNTGDQYTSSCCASWYSEARGSLLLPKAMDTLVSRIWEKRAR